MCLAQQLCRPHQLPLHTADGQLTHCCGGVTTGSRLAMAVGDEFAVLSEATAVSRPPSLPACCCQPALHFDIQQLCHAASIKPQWFIGEVTHAKTAQ